MEHIADYVALVQFAGAFNFAFATKSFQSHLSEHFFNVVQKCNTEFGSIRARVSSDLNTIKAKKPIMHEGKTNKDELKNIESKYSKISSELVDKGDLITRKVNGMREPRFSRQMFLMMGLYSIIALFFICKIGHSAHADKDIQRLWCDVYSTFNIVTLVWLCYFIIMEVICMFSKDRLWVLHPSFSWTMLLFAFLTPVVALTYPGLSYAIMDINGHVWLAIFMPFIAFAIYLFMFMLVSAIPWALRHGIPSALNGGWADCQEKRILCSLSMVILRMMTLLI